MIGKIHPNTKKRKEADNIIPVKIANRALSKNVAEKTRIITIAVTIKTIDIVNLIIVFLIILSTVIPRCLSEMAKVLFIVF